MLQPLLTSWIGDGYLKYYDPSIEYFSYRHGGFMIIIETNTKYQQGIYDNDNFRYMLSIIDLKDEYSYQKNLDKIIAALELLWANKIPTCTPGKEDVLPYEGGEAGPIPWP